MPKFDVAVTLEYTLTIEADDEDSALDAAYQTNFDGMKPISSAWEAIGRTGEDE